MPHLGNIRKQHQPKIGDKGAATFALTQEIGHYGDSSTTAGPNKHAAREPTEQHSKPA